MTPRTTVSFAWALVLAAATVIGSLAASCMMPFVALAVMSAATMTRRRAAVTVAAAWAANEAIGFTLLHFPANASSFGWGAAALVAALGAMLAASLLAARGRLSAARLAGAFVLGFAAYEGVMAAWGLAGGGLATFAPAIVAQIALNEAIWLVGLAAVQLLLTWRAPKLFGAAPALSLI
ncbi:hypothetical protein [Phenylobacterium sp.]|jgi:hypothetical protein|uniref:hypothetical protein n=1 Tax=Phenylobacterium sp. TaxID=1871053 RepID=UPI002E30029F|nr:hypothetical protein [Phenylobacterium sp.]HEX3366237.1 hypothetical protein [Phenylobacterium sp.]